jgi:hypothetical protein
MLPRNIELEIEELVLRGFAPEDCYSIGEAVQQELTRLLTERGVPPSLTQGGEIEHLDGESFAMTPGMKAEAIGSEIAHNIYGGLSK